MVEGAEAQGLRCPGWELVRCRDRGWTWDIWLQGSGLCPSALWFHQGTGAGDESECHPQDPREQGDSAWNKATFRSQTFFFLIPFTNFWGPLTSLFAAHIPASPVPLVRIPWKLIIICPLLLNTFEIRIITSGIFKQNEVWTLGRPGLCSGMDWPLQGKSVGEDGAGWLKSGLGPFPSQLWDAWSLKSSCPCPCFIMLYHSANLTVFVLLNTVNEMNRITRFPSTLCSL